MTNSYNCADFSNGYTFSGAINDITLYIARIIQGYSQHINKSDLQIWVGSQDLFDILYLTNLFDRKTLTILDVPLRVRMNGSLERIEAGIDSKNETEYLNRIKFVNLPLMFK